LGDNECAIAGGVESMSNFGYRLHSKTNKYGSVLDIENALNQNGNGFLHDFDIVDCLEEGLKDSLNDISMIEIAEIMANVYGVGRDEQDDYARQMLERAVKAVEGNRLEKFLTPLGEIKKDTYPINRKRMLKRPNSFAKAQPVFAEDSEFITAKQFMEKHKRSLEELGFQGGQISPTVTMYNSCIPGDGAGACIVATEEKAQELGLEPLLRIISWGVVGVNPIVMGIGPNEAVHLAFTQPKTERVAGLTMDHMDLIEIHEAFASQVLSVFKQSEKRYNRPWVREKVNIYGGSLAYTHPLGSTNIRLITNILSRFDEEPSARYALATCCAGGGQGAAFVFERYGG
jgi:acetyl-CoA C-acetyltransferase